jgi:shikimate kinase
VTEEALAPARTLLVGMMGAGKTTVGHALSARTGWPYQDNDDLVRRATGRSARDLLAALGEPGLRQAESAALDAAVRIPPPVIVSVAGGVVEDPAQRRVLRQGGFVVWLRGRLETLARRVGTASGRPWLDADAYAGLAALWRGRAALYEEVATVTVDVDDITPGEVVERIVSALAGRVATGQG